jgi:hypothetical protein
MLGAIATASMNGQDFASLLERAIARTGVKMIEAKKTEAEGNSDTKDGRGEI